MVAFVPGRFSLMVFGADCKGVGVEIAEVISTRAVCFFGSAGGGVTARILGGESGAPGRFMRIVFGVLGAEDGTGCLAMVDNCSMGGTETVSEEGLFLRGGEVDPCCVFFWVRNSVGAERVRCIR